ncbi:MAG: hypothetical protein A2636_05810 [Elusimicrobia bacterium RIFCSPHIGHO2_01_FULL_64_10]|nr:MAG: hypothetical protein A2636_05810 [Elusimicrobia bacterium RIFCSPHIGHO2_01_FULL_64_10]
MKKKIILAVLGLAALGAAFRAGRSFLSREAAEPPPASPKKAEEVIPVVKGRMPDSVRGIHLSAWVAGSRKARGRIDALFSETELNTVVIAVKETKGEVFVPGVPLAEKHGLFVNAVPDLRAYLARLKKAGVYPIARIVVFKDDLLVQARPDLAVRDPDGNIWRDKRGNGWADPYRKEVWEYNLSVATNALAAGFQEIQFDYIRYPSDGDTSSCRYAFADHTSSSAARNLNEFLKLAARRLKPLGAKISIDVFGLAPSVGHGMGIGQRLADMTEWADFVSPMVYPSHYAKGEFGIPEPDREPYMTVQKTLLDARRRTGDLFKRLRPYLQDFSLKHPYGPREVRAQIQALEDMGVRDWLLWDPNCQYTRAALKGRDGGLDPSAEVPDAMRVRYEDWYALNFGTAAAGGARPAADRLKVRLSTGVIYSTGPAAVPAGADPEAPR